MESAKKMRKVKLLAAAFVIALLSLTTTDILAFGGHPGKPGGGGCPGGNVGAPLDGGILTLLVGGGAAAYFAIKRKKKE